MQEIEAKALILDEDPEQARVLSLVLESTGFPVSRCENAEGVLRTIADGEAWLVFADVNTLVMNPQRFLTRTLQENPAACVVLMARQHSTESAAQAIRQGVFDFLGKPLEVARVRKTVMEFKNLLTVRTSDSTTVVPDPGWRPVSLAEVRRDHVLRVLRFCRGNRVHAAKLLGIGRTSLYRFLCRHKHVMQETSV